MHNSTHSLVRIGISRPFTVSWCGAIASEFRNTKSSSADRGKGLPSFFAPFFASEKKRPGFSSASFRDVVVKLNPPVPPLRTNLANPLQKRLNLVVLFPEAREAVPLVDINTGKKIGNIHDGGRAALGQHLRKSFSANEIAGQAVSQISAISVVTHVRRDGGAKVCRAAAVCA